MRPEAASEGTDRDLICDHKMQSETARTTFDVIRRLGSEEANQTVILASYVYIVASAMLVLHVPSWCKRLASYSRVYFRVAIRGTRPHHHICSVPFPLKTRPAASADHMPHGMFAWSRQLGIQPAHSTPDSQASPTARAASSGTLRGRMNTG